MGDGYTLDSECQYIDSGWIAAVEGQGGDIPLGVHDGGCSWGVMGGLL